MFDAEFDYEYPETVQLRGYTGHYEGNESDLDEAVKALGESRRPVLLTGGGIVSSDTAQVLQDVVEKIANSRCDDLNGERGYTGYV